MTSIKTILIASTALLIPTLAFAGPNNGAASDPSSHSTNVLNGQITFGAQWSTVNTTVNGAGGDVIVQSQGAGNVLDLTTFNNTNVDSTQEADSTNIGSTVNANVSNVYGGVSISGGGSLVVAASDGGQTEAKARAN